MPVTFDTDGTGNALLAAVKARRAKIHADARCTACGTARTLCGDLMAAPGNDAPFGCCDRCRHRGSSRDTAQLMDEWEGGCVRTVAELLVMLNDHPQPVTLGWLLHQTEWWQPQHGPMVRLSDMTDTHRYHLLSFLERKATMIARLEADRLVWEHATTVTGVDPFTAANEALRRPHRTVTRTPLWRVLMLSLPHPERHPDSWDDLVERAEHFSTCPRNRDLGVPECTCPEPDPALFDEASGKGV